MCFKNLPIDFDLEGRAVLRGDWAQSMARTLTIGTDAVPLSEQAERLERRREVSIDPVTRVAGALAFHAEVDIDRMRVVEAHSLATLFRGYEVILKGRDPRDAIDLSSRACGVCGGVHSTCSSMALEMAFGIVPPPMGVVARNLGETAEFLYDHPLHLFLLAGPDYSAMTVEKTTPSLWARAQKYQLAHTRIHGFATMAELMTAMNPLTGSLYLEALEVTRLGREMVSLMYGKFPHPSTLVPGGITTTFSLGTFNQYYTRLVKFFDYSKKAAVIWDEIADFFYAVNPRYREVGRRKVNFINTGIWDDPDAYDASYRNADGWGVKRWSTPGVVVDGVLRTTNLTDINIGLEEFIEHSYYDNWSGRKYESDPLGKPLSPYHPWNKETLPKPVGRSWKEKYSWSTAPRWDREAMETGPYTRLWVTAMAKKLRPNPFIESTGHGLKMLLPAANLPEMELQWDIPAELNAFERNRGRAYSLAFTSLVAYNNLLAAFDLLKQGKTAGHTPFDVPQRGNQLGVGFWEAGRGYLTHHIEVDNGRIANYQIITPSTFMASPKDNWGQPGPYEEAAMNTPILEEKDNLDELTAIDLLRSIRSFDPCMPCTTHIAMGQRMVSREVNTCACDI